MPRALATAFAALAGLAFGSFLNVCLSRWPAGESIVTPRSHCRSCGRTLAWWENIPLVSWLALRGRCRSCGVWIGWRYPLVELAIAALWAHQVWEVAPWLFSQDAPSIVAAIHGTEAMGTMIFEWLVVALAALDAEQLWLPDLLTLPGIAFGLFFAWLGNGLRLYVPHADVAGLTWYSDLVAHLMAAIAAAGLILILRWTYKLIRKREGIGLGDAKLMAMLAAWLGLEGAMLSFAVGAVIGALVALIVLVRSSSTGQEGWAATKLPFGTFLCIGGIVSVLWGQPIIYAYLRWSGL